MIRARLWLPCLRILHAGARQLATGLHATHGAARGCLLQRLDHLLDLGGRVVGDATTAPAPVRHHAAKLRPCSPAGLAASMAAFSASRLVCSAMPLMVARMPLDLMGVSIQLMNGLALHQPTPPCQAADAALVLT